MKARFFLPIASAFLLLLVASEAEAGVVTGRVLDSSGKPVAGSKVTWHPFRNSEERLLDWSRGSRPEPLGEVSTDAEGRFRIVFEKPTGGISLRIAASGLPSAVLSGPFDPAEETPLEDIQLVAAKKVSGRVVEETGKAVAGATVEVRSAGPGEENVGLLAEGKSGEDGRFTLPDAPEGAISLSVRANGFVPVSTFASKRKAEEKVTLKRGGTLRGTVLDPSGKAAPGAIVVAGELAAETDANGVFSIAGVPAGTQSIEAFWKEDFAARLSNVRIKKGGEREVSLRLARAATIAGTVLDEKTRKPVTGVSVSASDQRFRMGPASGVRAARTDGRGGFRIRGLAPRGYVVGASKEGYVPTFLSGVVASLASPGKVSIAIARAGIVSGRVTDEKGNGVAGARVRIPRDPGPRGLLRMAMSGALPGRRDVVSGPDGAFRLRNLAPSRNMSLEAVKTGYTTARRHGLSVKNGETVKDVTLLLRKGLEARGRVVDGQGKPIAGAEVQVSPRNREGMMGMVLRFAGEESGRPDATTGADGSFLVAGLEEGEQSVAVSREGFAPKTVPSLEVKAEGPNVWPPIVLSPGVAVEGLVKSGSGAPIAGALIFSFSEGGGPGETVSDPEGRFRLDGLSAGQPGMLNVSADGYAGLQRTVTPPVEELVLTLQTAGTIRGRAEDVDTKKPITSFSAGHRPQRGGMGGFQVSFGGRRGDAFESADGSFELTNVPPGKWTVYASAPGYRTAEMSGVEIAEGDTKEGIVLSLTKGGAVSGRVLDPLRGTGIANASVSWQPSSPQARRSLEGAAMAAFAGGSGSSTTTDADGKFRFEGLPTGNVVLTAAHPDFLETTREIEGGGDTTADLTLGTGGSIRGTVVDKDGRTPSAAAQVSLREQGDSPMGLDQEEARADASGGFLFEHLKPGRYRLSAQGNAGTSAPREVVLAEGQRLDGVLLEMVTGTLVRGTVTGLPAGKVGGVRVWAFAKDFNESAVTDDEGRFTLRDVPPGPLRLSASTSWMSGRTAQKTVEVPEGAPEVPAEIIFEGTSRLTGRVTRGDKPLPGLNVFATPDPPTGAMGSSRGQTDEDGRYALEGLSDGNYQVILGGAGVSYRKTFAVSGDTAGDIALPAVSVSGYVTESGSGEPIEDASVNAETGRETGAFAMKSAVTDSRGFYTLDAVDPGNYQVTARKDGYQLKTQTLSVGSSAAESNFVLARGAGVSIRAADGQTGLPLKGLSVLAFSAAGAVAFSGSVSLDSEGKGEISSLAPGSYAVYVFSQGYAPRSFPLVSVPSPTLAVAMTPGGRVEVRTDAPVTGRILDASGAAYLLSPWRLDGRVSASPPVASWDNFAPGSYRLVATTASGERSWPFTVAEGKTTVVEAR